MKRPPLADVEPVEAVIYRHQGGAVTVTWPQGRGYAWIAPELLEQFCEEVATFRTRMVEVTEKMQALTDQLAASRLERDALAERLAVADAAPDAG